ncbi:MAG: nitroreductase family protein [Chloroflexota bacterium]
MHNPTLALIHHHGSQRDYKPDPVPKPLVETIVAAAQRTSTSSNLQAYSVVAVTDERQRSRLCELCGGQKHIAAAPLFLAWCADLARLERACQIRNYTQEAGYTENFLIAAVDAAIAAQNAALAAQSLGLGICYIGAIRNDPAAVIELLGLPRLTFPVTGMTVGWPASSPPIRPRLPLNAVLHWERYNPDQDTVLFEYDAQMAATGIYNNRQVPAAGKAGQIEAYGWLEHSARRTAQPARTGLRAVLEAQGFTLK